MMNTSETNTDPSGLDPESETLHFSGKVSEENEEHLIRLFNTALISSKVKSSEDIAEELAQVMRTPEFRCLLEAVTSLADQTGMSYQSAAEALIATFRKVDKIWESYVFQEGVERIRGPEGGSPFSSV